MKTFRKETSLDGKPLVIVEMSEEEAREICADMHDPDAAIGEAGVDLGDALAAYFETYDPKEPTE